MSDALEPPPVGSAWIHRSGGRICKVVGIRPYLDHGVQKLLVEYRYRRSGTGMGRTRATPTQAMQLAEWRGIFTKQAEA